MMGKTELMDKLQVLVGKYWQIETSMPFNCYRGPIKVIAISDRDNTLHFADDPENECYGEYDCLEDDVFIATDLHPYTGEKRAEDKYAFGFWMQASQIAEITYTPDSFEMSNGPSVVRFVK